MRVLFVARHASGDNDDEGAIAHALRALGHEVTCLHERRMHRSGGPEVTSEAREHDLVLFLKWPNLDDIRAVSKTTPCAYWHFDMIESVDGDPTLAARSDHRIRWCNLVYPLVVAGFHTDGDWVDKVNNLPNGGKLVHLYQGFDERAACTVSPAPGVPEVLFLGMVTHGQRRAGHVAHLRSTWGDRFGVMGEGGPRRRYHGPELAALLAGAKVVVAPDGPGTDLYTSNRVFLTTGLGGFLIHPCCKSLYQHYTPGEHLQYYTSREHLDKLLEYYLDNPDSRDKLRLAGTARTTEANLYRHRVAALLTEVGRRLSWTTPHNPNPVTNQSELS
jgi:hypothetical protein